MAELLALPHTSRAELEARINALLPRWKSTASIAKGAEFFTSLVKLSARIQDPALAHGWLAPLGLHRLTTKQMRRSLAAVINQHGSPWAKELIEGWTKRQRWGTPAWAPLLADLCADLRASGSRACDELADWLLERDAKIAVDRCAAGFEQLLPWLDLEVFILCPYFKYSETHCEQQLSGSVQLLGSTARRPAYNKARPAFSLDRAQRRVERTIKCRCSPSRDHAFFRVMGPGGRGGPHGRDRSSEDGVTATRP